jgi:hypothetical protein
VSIDNINAWSARMAIRIAAPAEASSHTSHLATAILALALVVLLGATYTYGLHARAAAERAEIALVAQENQAFCSSLGISDTSALFTRCTDGLSAMRQRQRERFNAEAAGIL